MASGLGKALPHWFSKSIDPLTYPTQSIYLTSGVDRKNRPLLIMDKMPSCPAKNVKNRKKLLPLLIHHYITYLASLIPLTNLKNGLALIVDSNQLSKHEADNFVAFASLDYVCPFYQLVIYCILCVKNNIQYSLKNLPPGTHVIYVSRKTHLRKYILESQLPPHLGGFLIHNQKAMQTFIQNFEKLEMFICKDMNKYMMMAEFLGKDAKGKNELDWLKRNYDKVLRAYKTVKNTWDDQTLIESTRIYEKFKSPQKYFSSVMYNPAFQLAFEKLNLYMAELTNLKNFHQTQLHEMENFLKISDPSFDFKNSSPSSYIISKHLNVTFTDSEESHKMLPQKKVLELENENRLINNSNFGNEKSQNQSLKQKLKKLLSVSTPNLKSNESELNTPTTFYHSLPQNKFHIEKKDQSTQATLKTTNSLSRLSGKDPVMLVKDSQDVVKNIVEDSAHSLKNDLSKDGSFNHEKISYMNASRLSDTSLNQTEGIEKLYKWYIAALELFNVEITIANAYQEPDVELLAKVSNFNQNYMFPEDCLLSAQITVLETGINEKNDLNILIYRVFCLEKVLKNFKYLKLHELKEILFWKEQYDTTNSKNAPLQSFRKFKLKNVTTEVNPKNMSFQQKLNQNLSNESKNPEIYFIEKTPYLKKRRENEKHYILNVDESHGPTEIPHTNFNKHTPHPHYLKDFNLNYFLHTLKHKNSHETPKDKIRNLDLLTIDTSHLNRLDPPKKSPRSIVNEEFMIENPIYTSSSSFEERLVINKSSDPLASQSLSRSNSIEMENRITRMYNLLREYDSKTKRYPNEHTKPNNVMSTMYFPSDGLPIVTPPSYSFVTNNPLPTTTLTSIFHTPLTKY